MPAIDRVTFLSQLGKVDREIAEIGMKLMENVNFHIEKTTREKTLLPEIDNLIVLQKRMKELIVLKRQIKNIISLEKQAQGRF